MIWDKAGGTKADYDRDSYECEKDARQSGYFGTGVAGALNMREFFQKCMVAKGYTLRQPGASTVAQPYDDSSPTAIQRSCARIRASNNYDAAWEARCVAARTETVQGASSPR